jgi:RHS repeat-associated protein
MKIFYPLAQSKLIIFLFLAVFSTRVMAQVVPLEEEFSSNDDVMSMSTAIYSGTQLNPEGSSAIVQFPKPIQSTCMVAKDKSINDFVILKIDQEKIKGSMTSLTRQFGVTLNLRITAINVLGTEVIYNPTMKVDYNHTRHSKYVDAQVFKFKDAYSVKVEILNTSAYNMPKDSALTMVQLFAKVEVDRYLSFDNTNKVDFDNSFTVIPETPSVLNDNKPTKLTVTWDNSKLCWANEYELEWLYVDDYEDVDNNGVIKYTAPTNLRFDFERGATRVTLTTNSYELPLTYEHGYLLFRIRGIGRHQNSKTRLVGRWYDGGSNDVGLVSNYQARNTYKIDNPHELDKKNWQSITTYAEEGLRKDVISYYDGTFRKRQTVTVSSTDKKAIVAETIYDHQGRPGLNILPAPVNHDALRYYNNFNQNRLGKPYSKTDFDKDNNCVTIIDSMKTNAQTGGLFVGASNYYSKFNPIADSEDGRQIPDAGGYPFSVTRYTQDNTGRIAQQSGIGNAFLGDSMKHQTRYFYGTPKQEELDRLFGNEVGKMEHYKKNVVQDANGQMSVSYIDPDGKTIATALSGEAPANLQALDSKRSDIIKADLMASRYVDSIAGAIIAVNTHTVTTPGDYLFKYDINPKAFNTEGFKKLNLCYDCIYDLEISVQKTNSCDTAYVRRETLGAIFAGDSISRQCDTSAYTNVPREFSRFLGLGTYTVTKRLTVNKQSIEKYVEDYLSTFKTLRDTLISQELAKVDTSGCNITCATCEAALDDPKLTPEGIRNLVLLRELTCDSMTTLCDVSRDLMIQDMTPPYGQYAKVVLGGDTRAVDTLSFFNPNKMLPDTIKWHNPTIIYTDINGVPDSVENEAGIRVRPNELTLGQFVQNFKKSWADSLLKFHPEYHLLQWCDTMYASNRFDLTLQKDISWEIGKGKPVGSTLNNITINANARTSAYNNNSVQFDIVNNDPFFKDSYWGRAMKLSFLDSIKNYAKTNLNFLQLAIVSRTCPNANTAVQANSCLTNYTFGINKVEDDTIWSMAINLYVGKKQQFTDGARFIHSFFVKKRNADCIGKFGKVTGGVKTLQGLSELENILNASNVMTPCDKEHFELYKYKEKRFPGINDILAKMDPAMKDVVFSHSMDSAAVRQLAKNIQKAAYKDGECVDCTLKEDWRTFINGFLARPALANWQFVNPITSRYLNRPLFENLNRPDSITVTRRNSNDSILTFFFDEGVFKLINTDRKPWVANSTITITNTWSVTSEFYKRIDFRVTLPDGTDGGVGRLSIQNFEAVNPCRRAGLPYYVEYDVSSYLKNFPPTSNPNGNRFFLDKWKINSATPISIDFDNFKVLANMMTTWDGGNNWVYDSAKQVIRGGVIGSVYSPLVVYPNNQNCLYTVYDPVKKYYLNRAFLPKKPYQEIRWNINNVLQYRNAMPNKTSLQDTFNTTDVGGNWTIDTIREAGFLRYVHRGGNPIKTYGDMCIVYADSVVTVNPKMPYQNSDSTENYVEYKVDSIFLRNINYSARMNWKAGNESYFITYKDVRELVHQLNIYNSDGNWTYNDKSKIIRGRRIYNYYSPFNIVTAFGVTNGGTLAGFNAFLGGHLFLLQKDNVFDRKLYNNFLNPEKPYHSVFCNNRTFNVIPNLNALYDSLRIIDPNVNWSVSPTPISGNRDAMVLKSNPVSNIVTGSIGIVPADTMLTIPAKYKNNVNPTLPLCETPPAGTNDPCKSVKTTYIWNRNKIAVSPIKPLFVEWNVACDTFRSVILNQQMLLDFMNLNDGGNLAWSQDSNWLQLTTTNKTKRYGALVLSQINADKSLTPIDTLGKKTAIVDICKAITTKWNPTTKDFDTITVNVVPNSCEPLAQKPARIVYPDSINSCVAQKYAQARQIAKLKFQIFMDSMRQNVALQYKRKCLDNVSEVFTMTYSMSEYHYTLYYYDQANNLVKTVPPAGVHITTNADTLQRIKDYRNGKAGVAAVYMPHKLQTLYHYNSLNQVMDQRTPDAGESRFWYDRLGRLILSQNARQKAWNGYYSYTDFDKLGRIKEVGEIRNVGSLDTIYYVDSTAYRTLSRDTLVTYYRDKIIKVDYPFTFTSRNYTRTFNLTKDSLTKEPYVVIQKVFYSVRYDTSVQRIANIPKSDTFWQSWILRGERRQITRTQYDVSFSNAVNNFYTNWRDTTNMRNRVSTSSYWENGTDTMYQHATHYGYDIMGNVKTLVQSDPTGIKNKRMDYVFDQLSGKVTKVLYQAGKADAFYHRYDYDADLRLRKVETSRDHVIWDTDAEYNYYRHGPMRRMEIGQEKVQGLDYAYTIQGWIKGVNINADDFSYDNYDFQDYYCDNDNDYYPNAVPPSKYHNIPYDAFRYILSYYKGDYKSLKNVSYDYVSEKSIYGNQYPEFTPSLYNGNIRGSYFGMINNEHPFYSKNAASDPSKFLDGMQQVYQYDQLNRLKTSSDVANSDGSGDGSRGMSLTYDGNGNIQTLNRNCKYKGGTNAAGRMDDLVYYYKSGTNQLTHVNDQVSASTFSNDIDNQTADNYVYDEIGNLKRDQSEQITDIQWNVYGKMTRIMRFNANIETFRYDAAGNRVRKGYAAKQKWTYYVRDAQGNVMATYKKDTVGSPIEAESFYIYGSSRLGSYNVPDSLIYDTTNKAICTRVRGDKAYELSNHLGNVQVVVSDRKHVYSNSTGYSYYDANGEPINVIIERFFFETDIISATDYYAFGMVMPDRSINTEGYRFGFNGKENDNEIKGTGNQQDYGMRIYDPRLGRFLSTDPLTKGYPELTPFQFAGNKPIWAIDLDGLEPVYASEVKTISGLRITISLRTDKQNLKAVSFSSLGYQISNCSDGDPRCYHPNNTGKDNNKCGDIFLNSKTCKFYGNDDKDPMFGAKLGKNGQPLVQTEGQPAPGYFISQTFTTRDGFNTDDPDAYLNASSTNYLVASQGFINETGLNWGDVGVATANGVSVNFIIGEKGNINTNDIEISEAFIRNLGLGDYLIQKEEKGYNGEKSSKITGVKEGIKNVAIQFEIYGGSAYNPSTNPYPQYQNQGKKNEKLKKDESGTGRGRNQEEINSASSSASGNHKN